MMDEYWQIPISQEDIPTDIGDDVECGIPGVVDDLADLCCTTEVSYSYDELATY